MNFSNEILFQWRKLTPKLRWKNYSEELDIAIEQNLFDEKIAHSLSSNALRQNLFYSWILDQLPIPFLGERVRTCDVGSKDFSYAPALARFYSHRVNFSAEVLGIELDPYRLYSNFYRRKDCALYYVKVANQFQKASMSYRSGDWLRESSEHFDVITCFFPFLFSELHTRFGLRRSAFNPSAFYAKLFERSNTVIFFHQGEEEKEESLRLIEHHLSARVLYQNSFFENPWMQRKHPVEVLIVKGQQQD